MPWISKSRLHELKMLIEDAYCYLVPQMEKIPLLPTEDSYAFPMLLRLFITRRKKHFQDLELYNRLKKIHDAESGKSCGVAQRSERAPYKRKTVVQLHPPQPRRQGPKGQTKGGR